MKSKNGIRGLSLFIVFIISVLLNLFPIAQGVSAATVKLNKKSATLWVGDTLQLKLQNTDENATWKSNRTSVASVSAKGKVKAKKSGKAVITATVKSKKYKCTVTVRQTSISAEKLTLVYGTSESLTISVSHYENLEQEMGEYARTLLRVMEESGVTVEKHVREKSV